MAVRWQVSDLGTVVPEGRPRAGARTYLPQGSRAVVQVANTSASPCSSSHPPLAMRALAVREVDMWYLGQGGGVVLGWVETIDDTGTPTPTGPLALWHSLPHYGNLDSRFQIKEARP